MKPSTILEQRRGTIRSLVLEYGVTNPRVFGSVIRQEDTDDSDLDILVDPAVETSLLDIAKLELRLEKELGIHVDVLTSNALPAACRSYVLEHAIPV